MKAYLKKYFGYEAFRYGQQEIIDSVLKKNNVLVVMPTGGGKSLCYQLPALMLDGTAIVVSPLIALMQDQVSALLKNNIPATFINSSLSFSEINERFNDAQNGKYKLIYIAPERLGNSHFLNLLKNIKLSFIAIDEAHCISEWGHDFRPSYLSIVKSLESIIPLPIIALTATATPDVCDDIVSALKMNNVKRFIRGFDRPNLRYITEYCDSKLNRIIELCGNKTNGSTIIYCGSRKHVEELSFGLNKNGIKALPYHAGMKDEIRAINQDKFINGNSKIIVATNAFGMGIDKADVRQVIHCDMTMTLEEYYQEAGRAGRDSLPSDCYLLYHPNDIYLQEFFIKNTFPKIDDIKKVYDFIYDINSVAVNSKPDKIIYLSETQIANKIGLHISTISSILSLFERYEITKQKFSKGTDRIKFICSEERIKEYYNNITDEKKLVFEAVLRTVSDRAFRDFVEFDTSQLKLKFNLRNEDYKKSVRSFALSRIIDYIPYSSDNGIELIKERFLSNKIPIDFEAYSMRNQNAVRKLDLVRQYIESKECKRNIILNYFNESEISGKCGKCSSCKPNYSVIEIKPAQKKSFNKQISIFDNLDAKYDEQLLDKLISIRQDIASQSNLSPESLISIFDLKNIAILLPRNLEILKNQCNLSQVFIKKYGYLFIDAINNHIENKTLPKEDNIVLSNEAKLIIRLVKSGMTILQISKKQKLTEGEVAKFIQEAIEFGEIIDKNKFVSSIHFQIIIKELKKHPKMPLRDIREKLNLDIDYPTLRVATALARKELNG